jgi:phosphoribosylformylglycinamidine synthase
VSGGSGVLAPGAAGPLAAPDGGAAPAIGVVRFPGSCDDRDALRALELAGARPKLLPHDVEELDGVSGVLLPGGFSYGDYLRCGAIARFAPVMAAVTRFAAAGGPVLGICNGFQVLCEARLLPGVLRPNHSGRFVCRDVDVVVQHADGRWLPGIAAGERLRIPVKHHDGAWFAPPPQLHALAQAGQLLLRYADNPNGASGDVAGVTSEAGNVLGLMPHPEHAVDPLLGPTGGRPLLHGLVGLAQRFARAA